MKELKELSKLEKYLKDNNIAFVRIDEDGVEINTLMGKIVVGERHQIVVDDCWDVICQPNSYGWKEGLLELSGSLVRPEFTEDGVEGWLTAEDVINRLETLKCCKAITIQIDRIATDSDNFDMFHVKGTNTLWLTKGQLDRLLKMNNIQKEVFYERLYTKTSCSCK